ncbi:MAG: NAD-dependent epimerase/dehydratase, partial [Ilumatobacteraceae bacterium]|nr:NAD-dependent epimerase/dehydratase [Ilumatobacteraceae bacterium]
MRRWRPTRHLDPVHGLSDVVTALVVGGTGPTGPAIVNGLLQRGHVVTILHSGRHEVEFDRPVEHIHADAHSAESLADAIGSRTFDIGIGMYGRLRVVAAALAGHVAQFIGVGGVFYDGWVNNQFHTTATGDIAPLVPPPYTSPAVPVDETSPMDADPNNKFARLALASEQLVMDLHAAQRFRATMLRFPKVYGPRAIAPLEWSVVRRVLDGRRQ